MIRQEIITVLFAFLFSATIEFLQYALPIGRISNVDDVILNTLGGIIGMLVGVIVLKFGIVYNRVRKGR
ncbi:VanZ family protein [Salinicoccus sp. CNSTN-B1]